MCCEEQSMSDHGVEPWVPPPPAAKKVAVHRATAAELI